MEFKEFYYKYKTLIYTVSVIIISIILLVAGIFYYVQNEKSAENDKLSSDEIVVHIKGGVAFPGVYTLFEDARISDAIAAAGGTGISKSCLSKINLAEKLTDGQEIIIPGIYLEDPFNINTATANMLTSIPGISKAVANSIIEHRTLYGDFKSKEELLNVHGLLLSEYELLYDYITISDYILTKKM